MTAFLADIIGTMQSCRGPADVQDCLHAARDRLGLSHITYAAERLPNARGVLLMTSYGDEWIDRYISSNYAEIDPVVREARTSLLPVSWSDCCRSEQDRAFLREAEGYGVGNQGIAVPVRGPHGDFGMLTGSAQMTDAEWAAWTQVHSHDLIVLTHHCHAVLTQRMLSEALSGYGCTIGECGADLPTLSPRELDCLRWAAQGKTAWETAAILEISDRTVVFHLHNAKTKLGVANKQHAVAKALGLGIL